MNQIFTKNNYFKLYYFYFIKILSISLSNIFTVNKQDELYIRKKIYKFIFLKILSWM